MGEAFGGFRSDLRYVRRVLVRSPGFTLVAVFSLAIGIGANTSMFGVIRALLLTPLPVVAPDELALVTWRREGGVSISQSGSTSYKDPADGASLSSNFTYPLYRALREAAPQRSTLFAFAFLRGVSVSIADQPAFLAGGALADGAYFAGVRPRMALGRGLTTEDDRAGAPLVVILGHSFWMRSFGGDPSVVGRTVRLNGVPAEVVGVTAEGFRGLSMGGFFPQTEVTLPLAAQPRVYPRLSANEDLFTSDRNFWLRIMIRVPDGVSPDVAEAALTAALRAQPSPLVGGDEHLPTVRLIPGSQGAQPIQPQMARLLYLLLGVVGIVLLIACANLASLMLARGVARQREMAIRQALGGGRARLVRQVLLESGVLAAAGTAVGVVLALASRPLLADLLTGSLGASSFGNVETDVALDPWVLSVTVGLGVAATLLFGLAPALRLSRSTAAGWLKERAAGASNPRLRGGRFLIAGQIALSVPLVVGAALFLRSVANLGAVELGFDPEGLATFQVDPGYTPLSANEYPRLYAELLEAVRAVPGVRSATLMENALLSGIVSNTTLTLDDRRVSLYLNAIGPGFLETLGTRLVAGRVPGAQDGPEAPLVAAVNEAAVRDLFGGSSPVGRVLRVGSSEYQIVGVVNDTPYRSQRDPIPAMLYPSALQRNGYGGHHVVIRTAAPAEQLAQALREAVYRVDSSLPVPDLRTQTALIEQTTARERIFMQLLTAFGAFALLLAAIGLHGVTSYAVTRRTSEIGVRVAVGARPGQIAWLILRQVTALGAIGLALGVPLSLVSGPLIERLLFGVEPTHPITVAAASLLMLCVTVAAGLAPAVKAARLDAVLSLTRS